MPSGVQYKYCNRENENKMKSYKELLNERANEGVALRQLSHEEVQGLKSVLLDIYKDLAKVCEEHGLVVMLCGGSCLGAVRHQGFIPWDDDLDMIMPRKDYEQLKKLLVEGAMGEQYEFLFPSKGQDSLCMFMKIYRKGTKCVEMGNEYTKFPKGIAVDIFPLDGASSNPVWRKLVGVFANGLRLTSNMVYEASYPVSEATRSMQNMSGAGGWMMKARKVLGKLMSVVPHKQWVNWFDALVSNERRDGLLAIPTGRKLYGGEIFPADVYLPPRKAMFEGVEVYIPNKVEEYLVNLYGVNYMQLPPVEKRERHFIVDFDLNSSE